MPARGPARYRRSNPSHDGNDPARRKEKNLRHQHQTHSFVVSGAFDGLDKIIRRRLREATIGFAGKTPTIENDEKCLDHVQTRDFIDFGFEPEFIGRLPVRVICQQLNMEDLFLILKTSEGSIIRQYEQSFSAYGIEVLFRDDGLRQIAEMAAEEKPAREA